ncbi:hypothetical protein [Streptomyces sp. CB01881]|uniref:hypothetical protein n=1 Tax=Streptomyces sp. CB01881 TaxID=2078691 RepID=UPI000CDC1DF8|nr:hypothetical protein [Streptomyces sp. CB01881]AUY53300.1 hypothetical protein C2142_35325 [Streptomyces sp. CB01881]TYC69457.1 hypothetical protein EH183_35395 [Streptomyces sp. CB01881]
MDRIRITGEDPDGHQHVVRVVSRRHNQERVVCDSCGYSRWSAIGARDKAERHLAESHDAEYFRQEHAPGWWVATAIGLIGFVAFLFSPYGFFH